jgi:hypothetical protein
MAIDWLSWMPHVIASGVIATVAFFIITYIRTKKLRPTDEPAVGEYHIEVDVGTVIHPFKGTLFYNTKFLNEQFYYEFAKLLSGENTEVKTEELIQLKDYLNEKCHMYAMRVGTKKIAFISVEHPIEISPYFKTEERTGRKIVHATGWFNKHEINGFQQVTMAPIDLKELQLNPKGFETLGKLGEILAVVSEKGPLIQEIRFERQRANVLQTKVDQLSQALGESTDEIEYWKHLARGSPAEKEKEEGFGFRLRVPSWVKELLPSAFFFIIGILLSPAIPQLEGTHPVVLGIGFAAIAFIGKKVLVK